MRYRYGTFWRQKEISLHKWRLWRDWLYSNEIQTWITKAVKTYLASSVGDISSRGPLGSSTMGRHFSLLARTRIRRETQYIQFTIPEHEKWFRKGCNGNQLKIICIVQQDSFVLSFINSYTFNFLKINKFQSIEQLTKLWLARSYTELISWVRCSTRLKRFSHTSRSLSQDFSSKPRLSLTVGIEPKGAVCHAVLIPHSLSWCKADFEGNLELFLDFKWPAFWKRSNPIEKGRNKVVYFVVRLTIF